MTKADYKKELANGTIGWIEYHLHKDKTWIAEPFQTLKECKEKLSKLEKNKYKGTPVFFEAKLFKLDNPNLTAKEYLQNLIDVVNKYSQ